MDSSQIMQLLHHKLLDRELADDAFFDTALRCHFVDVEMDIQLVFVFQTRNTAISTDSQLLFWSSDADILERQMLSIATEIDAQQQRHREARQDWGKRTGNILQNDTSCDRSGRELKWTIQFLAGQ